MADDVNPDTGFITIHNQTTGGEYECSPEAFDLVWKDKGWKKGPLQGKTNTPKEG